MSSVIGGLLGAAGGGQIGSAVVNLQLATTQYNEQMAKAEAETKAKTSSMTSATSKLGAASVAVYAAVAVAVADFAKNSVEAAIGAAEANLKLANSIQNSKTVTEAAIPVFNAQAAAVSSLTGSHVDAITAMQAFLVQMHLTQAQVTTLTPLVVDLATKQGIDLTTAAKAVGKAVNGTTGGLSRMGVVVDKVAAKTNAYGATVKALSVVQGFAAKSADEKPWVLLGNSIHNLEITVGNDLLPLVKEVSVALSGLVPVVSPALSGAFKLAAESIQPFAQTLGQLSQVVDKVNTSTQGQTTSTNAVSDAMHHWADVITLPATALKNYNVFALQHLGLTHQTIAATGDVTHAEEGYSQAIQKNTAALRANRQQVLADAGGLLGLSASLAQLATDEAAVTKARKAGTLASAAGQAAERTYLTDKVAFIQALKTERDAMIKSHDSTAQIVTELTKLGTAAGITRQEILRLIAGINGLPTNKQVNISVVQHHRLVGP